MKVLLVLVALIATASALPRQFRAVSGGGKIVGGIDAKEGELPYQLSLQWFGNFICGASLIGPKLALTAAHCVDAEGMSAGDLQVIAGELNRNVVSGDEQTLKVERIVVHGSFGKPSPFSNDIALLFLSDEAVLNDKVKVAPTPPQAAQTTGTVRVSGWGTTSFGGSLTATLKLVDIPVVEDSSCQDSYPDETINDYMLCAGLIEEGGKDSCQGDSGGPLVSISVDSPTVGHLVGIVSWGYGCGYPGLPGVNTEVSYFADWIARQKELYLYK